MSAKVGATGNYPEGSLGKGDEGELLIAVSRDRGNVVLEFGKPVAWMAMPPEGAIKLARLLLRHAGIKSVTFRDKT